MKEPIWVLRETVEALHDRLLSEFGGPAGIRDEGMMESALSRPRNQFAFGKKSLADLAAAYAFGLVRDHPFIDGNKMVGFATAILFLEINGRNFSAGEADAAVKTLALAAHELDETGYAEWLHVCSKKPKPTLKRRVGRRPKS